MLIFAEEISTPATDSDSFTSRLVFLLPCSSDLSGYSPLRFMLSDPGIGLTEMHEYGYSRDEAKTLIEDMGDIESHGGILGIDKSQWGLYQEREAHAEVDFEERNMEPIDQLLLRE